MGSRFDTIVIGLGAMGAATCWQLTRRAGNPAGRVLGLEQHGIPHAFGSSHGDSRVIRLCYNEHPDYVPLLRRAFELWHDIERESGRTLLHMTGGVYMGPESGTFIQDSLNTMRTHDLPHEFLSRQSLAGRYPQFNVPQDHAAIHETNAGVLLPEAAISAMIEHSLRHGAAIHAHERVIEWSADAGGVRVRTDRATYDAARLIITAGPWSERLLGDLDVPLTVTRQVLGWVWPRRPELFELGRFPVWGIDDPAGGFHYGFPMLRGDTAGRPGLKLARHHRGPLTTPETVARTPDEADRAEIESLVSTVLPDGAGPALSLTICLYTNTPDGHFIIDQHPQHANVVVAAGFSGHGYKFASVVGEVLSELALDGATHQPIDFLRLNRFAAAKGTSVEGPG